MVGYQGSSVIAKFHFSISPIEKSRVRFFNGRYDLQNQTIIFQGEARLIVVPMLYLKSKMR